MYDYNTWVKELKIAANHAGKDHNIINSVALLQRLHGLSVDEAKTWIKKKCFECEEEYLSLKRAYLSNNPELSLPEDVRKWFDCQEAIATGFAIWCATTYRHHPPHEVGYHQYYAKRLREGAEWFDNVTDSERLMPGGYEVGKTSKVN